MSKEDIEKETISNCDILYKTYKDPMTKSCMCFGWECQSGWFIELRNMSYELETLNKLFYPKYRTRIQLDQVKEKFGYLTVYHSIVTDNNWFVNLILKFLLYIQTYLTYRFFDSKINSILKKIVSKIYNKAFDILVPNYSPDVERIRCYLENKTREIIIKSEDRCHNICEFCGRTIGTDYSPRYETRGWIKYICKKCADTKKIESIKEGGR